MQIHVKRLVVIISVLVFVVSSYGIDRKLRMITLDILLEIKDTMLFTLISENSSS
jgi:hypothetical protein